MLLYREVETERCDLEVLVVQSALIEEAVLTRFERLVKRNLECRVVNGFDIEVHHLTSAGVASLESHHRIAHVVREGTTPAYQHFLKQAAMEEDPGADLKRMDQARIEKGNSRTSSLRDTLLPRLMSGEIEVRSLLLLDDPLFEERVFHVVVIFLPVDDVTLLSQSF